MTKWRHSKGDDQLDFTYSSAPIPHHISDQAMSELAVCIYKVGPAVSTTECMCVRCFCDGKGNNRPAWHRCCSVFG